MNSQAHLPFHRLILILLLLVFAGLSLDARAVDVKGVQVPSGIDIGGRSLVLNGTAVRTVWGFSVYVCALYVSEASESSEKIMKEDLLEKRVHITMLREVSKEKFTSTIRENIDTNFSNAEKTQFTKELQAFLDVFGEGADLKKGSTVNIDFFPEEGMLITVNGQTFDPIPGQEFYHAILRLWIGEPLQKSIKSGLLKTSE